MPDSGRDGADVRLLEQLHDGVGRIGGGDVDVLDAAPEQGVAHAAADEADLRALGGERGDHGAGRRRRHPRLRGDAERRLQGLAGRPAGGMAGVEARRAHQPPPSTSRRLISMPAVAPQMKWRP